MNRPLVPLERVLVPTDLSPRAEAAVDFAVCLAAADGAEVVLLHVFAFPYDWYHWPSEALTGLRKHVEHEAEARVKTLARAKTTPTVRVRARLAVRSDVPSNAQGVAAVEGLVPGRYAIEVTFPGFEKLVLADVRVRAGDNRRDAVLAIQKLDETVSVGRDKATVASDPNNGLVVLADGMGGYNAGEVASGMATTVITTELAQLLAKTQPYQVDQESKKPMAEKLIRDQVLKANTSIYQAAQSQARVRAMSSSALCMSAMCASGNAARKRASSCGVRLISGTMTSAWPPERRTSAMACR